MSDPDEPRRFYEGIDWLLGHEHRRAGSEPNLCTLKLTEGEIGILLRFVDAVAAVTPQAAEQATYLTRLIKGQMALQWNDGGG